MSLVSRRSVAKAAAAAGAAAPVGWALGAQEAQAAGEGAAGTARAEAFGFGMPWESLYGYSQAMRVGDTLYVSGQLSHDQDGNFVGVDDFELQVRTALGNLDVVLRHFVARRDQIVETTVLVRNLRDNFDVTARLHAEYFGRHRPTSTVMGVSDLALPDQLVEIGAVARLDVKA
ncbi:MULTISPECIES: RidA family protein [unclassified Streptomyces]|uniref:RidA family protein n=1 Tax=unclassified Streptomyces TaxID=2593676 RepID=UPI000B2DDBB5|nr:MULTISPECIES: RidA family protein [unclassified Streptomyces]